MEKMIQQETTNKQNHEVEVRCLLSPQQYDAIQSGLQKGDAEFLGDEYISDLYFCHGSAKSFQEIEMDEVGSYSLRLRNSIKDGKSKVDLNMKIITEQGDHNAWEEHEISVSSFDEAKQILNVLGFKPYFQLEKHRTNFALNNMTVILEDIADFGRVMEVEMLTEQKMAQNAKDTIRNFMRESGITDDQIVPKSVTNMLMRERSSF